MQINRDEIKAAIFAVRPNLGESSIKTYTSSLANIPRRMGRDDYDGPAWFQDNIADIVDHLANQTPARKRGVLDAVYAVTGNESVLKLGKQEAADKRDISAQQKMTDKEKESWMSWDDIMARYADVRAVALPLLNTKRNLSADEMQMCSDFVLFSFLVLIPPRRALDFAVLALRDAGDDENSLVGKKVVFRKYKTVSSYGVQMFALPSELLDILKKWKRINTGKWLLWMGRPTRAPVSSDITRRLNHIIRDKVSVNQLRHSFLTEFYSGKTPSLQEMRDVSSKMAHNIVMSMGYRRLDTPDSDSD